jgi:dihydroorotate dehydrogenase (fumarate)
MDLTTRYVGLDLVSPFVVGASPLADDVEVLRRLEDAGAGAVVMHSLFEEQIRQEQLNAFLDTDIAAESHAEAASYFPQPETFNLGPETYIDQLLRLKDALQIPVMASLNGTTEGGWLEYAQILAEAGADGLELNIYFLATGTDESAESIEDRIVRIVSSVTDSIDIPVAVKLSPFFTALPHLAGRLADSGAAGLVLFNRFYQPDIDPEKLDVTVDLKLSDPSELLLRLRWLAILYGRVPLDLSVTGGVHGELDAVKAVMAGAQTVQMVSALLRHGPDALARTRDAFGLWLEEMEYTSLVQMRGSMSHARCPDPAAFERGNYAKILQSWEGRSRARGVHLFN